MNRFHLRMRSVHDRNGRDRIALRAVLGCLLVLLTTGAFSVHGHDLDPLETASISAIESGGDAPGPLHDHAPADLADCQICELNRRGEVEEAVPTSALIVAFDRERPLLAVQELIAAPRAPTRGRPSPRAPPVFSV